MKNHISSAMTNCGSPSQSMPLVGYRFHPTDDELLTNFLKPKMLGRVDYWPPIPEIKVCDYEPWDLPALINTNSDDQVWYFFCPRDYKYLRSRRSNRRTEAGYWKPTGNPRRVLTKRLEQIGTKKSLVFYIKEQAKPIRTRWIMHEYECALNSTMAIKGDFVLCKLKSKADEKISEGELVHMVFKSDLENQNLNEMTVNSSCDEHEPSIHVTLNETTVNSSCDEHEPSIHISSDIDGYNNPNEMTNNMSNYEENEWTCLATGFDCENQNLDEITTTTNSTEDKSNYYLGSDIIGSENPNKMTAMSTSANDFEGQNPYQKTDISASEEEGEWNSPYGPTLPDASNSTTTDNNVAQLDPVLNYINELDMEEFGKLIQEDMYNSPFYQVPMSPNEISSYSSFGVEGKGSEIGWDNELFSLFP